MVMFVSVVAEGSTSYAYAASRFDAKSHFRVILRSSRARPFSTHDPQARSPGIDPLRLAFDHHAANVLTRGHPSGSARGTRASCSTRPWPVPGDSAPDW